MASLVKRVSRTELEDRKAFLLHLLDVLRNYTESEVEGELADVRFLLREESVSDE